MGYPADVVGPAQRPKECSGTRKERYGVGQAAKSIIIMMGKGSAGGIGLVNVK